MNDRDSETTSADAANCVECGYKYACTLTNHGNETEFEIMLSS